MLIFQDRIILTILKKKNVVQRGRMLSLPFLPSFNMENQVYAQQWEVWMTGISITFAILITTQQYFKNFNFNFKYVVPAECLICHVL